MQACEPRRRAKSRNRFANVMKIPILVRLAIRVEAADRGQASTPYDVGREISGLSPETDATQSIITRQMQDPTSDESSDR